ncbi:MAG: DnaB-like helicase C-terminal domain-containing protein [Telluria sp.]
MSKHISDRNSHESIRDNGGKTTGRVSDGIAGFLPIQKFLTDAVERVDTLVSGNGGPLGVETGFHEFDELTSGLRPGELTVIAGRSKSGRTAFVIQTAIHMAKAGKSSAFFARNLTGEELATRMICFDSGVACCGFSSGRLIDEDWPKLTQGIQRLNELPLHVRDGRELEAAEMCLNAKALAEAVGGLGAVFIDPYPPFSMLGREVNREEVNRALQLFKSLAEELACPVVVVAPVKIDQETRAEGRTTVADIWYCSEVDVVADMLVLMHRLTPTVEYGLGDTVEVRVVRQRNGPEGTVTLGFNMSQAALFTIRGEPRGLPELDGTLKQAQFAQVLRERHRVRSPSSPYLYQQTSSGWWIENKDLL